MFQIVAGRFSTYEKADHYREKLALDCTLILPDHDRGGFKVIAWRRS